MAGPSSEVTFHGDLNLEPSTESETEQSSRSMSLEDFVNNLCFSEDVRARAHARGTTPAAAIMNHFLGVPTQNPSSSNNGPTLTLEDFLVRAGIPNFPQAAPPPPQQPPQPPPQQQRPPVGMYPNRRVALQPQPPRQQHQPPFGMYPNRPVFAIGIPVNGPHPLGNLIAYRRHAVTLAQGAYNYQRGGMRAPSAPAVSYVTVGPPVSPVSSDGESPVGLETGMVGGQKRETDGTKEKVVERQHIESPLERRQRKMIKHRESAARSRAMKQAHLLGLELDHKQLAQENYQLKQTVVDLLNKLNQQRGSGSVRPSA